MPTVYIVQDSPGRNFLPARDFGELKVLLSKHDGNLPPDKITQLLKKRLEEIRYTDYLVLVGSPVAIGLCVHVALQRVPEINVLMWDRVKYVYRQHTLESLK